MHAQILILAVAGLAAAQSSTSSAAAASSSVAGSTSGCGTQIDSIISSCLGTTQAQLNACATNDWKCMCEQSNNVLTCYNNCPSDPNRNGVEQQNISWCNAAKAEAPSSSSSTGSMTATASASGSGMATSASSTGSGSETQASSSGSSSSSMLSPTSTGSSSSTSSSSAAIAKVVPGLLAILGLAVAI